MKLIRIVEQTENIDVVLDCEDIRELFERAGYPINSGDPVSITVSDYWNGTSEPIGNLGQSGVHLVLRKSCVSTPVYQKGQEVETSIAMKKSRSLGKGVF